jgi:hypothetical protein
MYTMIREGLSLLLKTFLQATGGSDGAIRLFPLETVAPGRPLFTAPKKDTIVAFDVSASSVVLVTRSG